MLGAAVVGLLFLLRRGVVWIIAFWALYIAVGVNTMVPFGNVVGALLQIGHDDALVTALAFVAILVASINVFGGFAVTRRMLGMFTRGPSTGSTAR